MSEKQVFGLLCSTCRKWKSSYRAEARDPLKITHEKCGECNRLTEFRWYPNDVWGRTMPP